MFDRKSTLDRPIFGSRRWRVSFLASTLEIDESVLNTAGVDRSESDTVGRFLDREIEFTRVMTSKNRDVVVWATKEAVGDGRQRFVAIVRMLVEKHGTRCDKDSFER